jgi:hypothetical protein
MVAASGDKGTMPYDASALLDNARQAPIEARAMLLAHVFVRYYMNGAAFRETVLVVYLQPWLTSQPICF